MTTDEKDFLGRWSRRKQAAREGMADPEPEQAAVPAENAEPSVETTPPADESAYADIDFDALDYASDYTRFMAKDVPEVVQRRALRALWRSDPILANIDGLNDYDDDFTDAARAVANLVTSYKPGQGYRTDEEMAALEADEKAEAEARAQAETAEASQESGETPETEAAAAEDGSAMAESSGEADAPDTAPAGEPTTKT